MVGVGGWCAPKARARKAGLPKEMACRGIGVSQKPECPIARPQACPCNMKKPVTWMSSPAAKKVKHHGSVRAEGVKGAIADFVRFHCPLVASAEAIPPATKNTTPLAGESCCINKSTALLERPAVRSRSCARQYEAGRKSYLGAHLRMRKVTGRDASLPAPLLSAFVILVARGTVGALPQTPQGSSAP